MQESYLYEYAVIRLVPKVEREEFINIGIILFSKKAKYIKIQHLLDFNKLNHFCNLKEVDIEQVELTLNAFQKISLGKKEGLIIAKLDIPERFRWLTSMRSTIIQTSRPHSGLTFDLDKTFDLLFQELVL